MTHPQEDPQQCDPHTSWHPPDRNAIRRAITTARAKRKKRITRTIVFKLHKPGGRKTRALLWAQVHVTNMTAHVLETLRETPGEVRTDRAFACIQEAYARKARGAKSTITTILGDILAVCFTKKQFKVTQEEPDAPLDSAADAPAQVSDHRTWTPPIVTPVKAADYPVTYYLRRGVYREVARMLLVWYGNVTRADAADSADDTEAEEATDAETLVPEEAPDAVTALIRTPDRVPPPTTVFAIAAVHAQWAQRRQSYEAAAETIVPFGWYRGKTLAQVGKREVRWLRERVIPAQVARETLDHVEVLLDPERYADDPTQLHAAQQARHPWRRKTGLQRKTRVNRAFQRSLDIKEPLVRLRTLQTEELLNLQSELDELIEFADQFAVIRTAVDRFLDPAPARYPTVHALLTPAEWQAKRAAYNAHLDTLDTRIFEGNQEQAAQAANDFQMVASEIGRSTLQPLAFKRPMRPGRATFALLYAVSTPNEVDLQRKYKRMHAARRDKKIAQVLAAGDSITYVLAVVVHGEAAFLNDVAAQQRTSAQPDTSASPASEPCANDVLHLGTQPPERFEPNVKPGLLYVNYPATPFVPPKGTSVLLFPVECGERYHEELFLRRIIDAQRVRQEAEFAALQKQHRKQHTRRGARRMSQEQTPQPAHEKKIPVSKEAYFPRTPPLGSARILSKRTADGTYDFYVHMPVADATPDMVRTVCSVVGFHEHADGYSYARIDFNGTVLEVGDVVVAPHALPKAGDITYSDNYVYETVKAMTALGRSAKDHELSRGAIIGLENTAWKKQRVSLSREQNRRQFARPSRKIAMVLGDKAAQVGLPRLLERFVSRNQCSACSARRDPSIRNIYPKTEHCPTCGSTNLQETAPDSGIVQCRGCERVWHMYDAWFVCPTCGYRQMARLNTAIVVAQSTLTGFVTYYAAVRHRRDGSTREG